MSTEQTEPERIEQIKDQCEYLSLAGMQDIQAFVNMIVAEMIEFNIQ